MKRHDAIGVLAAAIALAAGLRWGLGVGLACAACAILAWLDGYLDGRGL